MGSVSSTKYVVAHTIISYVPIAYSKRSPLNDARREFARPTTDFAFFFCAWSRAHPWHMSYFNVPTSGDLFKNLPPDARPHLKTAAYAQSLNRASWYMSWGYTRIPCMSLVYTSVFVHISLHLEQSLSSTMFSWAVGAIWVITAWHRIRYIAIKTSMLRSKVLH